MTSAGTSYVREENGTLYISTTHVTVYSLIAAWKNEGYSAEELQFGFPVLSLAEVYGTIAYYLDHQQELDALFGVEDQEYYRQRARDRSANPDFYRQLEERKASLRRRINTPHSLPGAGTPDADETH